MNRLDTIKAKLAMLAEADRELSLFGAGKHKYALNACLTEAEVQEIEEKYRITLPDDYRRFLKEAGNGGAGPYYGIKPLNRAFPTRDMERDPDLMSKPFPLTKPLYMMQECVGSANLDEYYRRIETDDAYYDKIMRCVSKFNGTKYSQGALLLSDYGDGVLFQIILAGAERGNVWVDDRANQGGIFPMAPEEKQDVRTDFLSWYENWLDISLQRTRGDAPNEAGGYFEFANA